MKKRFFAFISMFLLMFSLLGSFAYANDATTFEVGDCCKATTDITVYVMLGREETALFTIPLTYYFDIVDSDNEVYYISYNGLNINNNEGFFIRYENNFITAPTNEEFLQNGFSLQLKINSAENVDFYKQQSITFKTFSLSKSDTLSISFIGKHLYKEKDCAFVKVEDTQDPSVNGFGYIEVSNLATSGGTSFSDYNIPDHKNSQPKTPDTNDPTPQVVPTEPTNDLVRTVLIIGIVIPAVIIIFLLFKPNNNNQKGRYDYNRNTGYDYGESKYDKPRSRYDKRYDHDRYDYNKNPYNRYDDKNNYNDPYDDSFDDRYDDRRYNNRNRKY